MPMVLGPSRRNYEQFLPLDTFTHADNFPSPEELAQDLRVLDKDHAGYLSSFCWWEVPQPRSCSWALMFCKACWQL